MTNRPVCGFNAEGRAFVAETFVNTLTGRQFAVRDLASGFTVMTRKIDEAAELFWTAGYGKDDPLLRKAIAVKADEVCARLRGDV
ncbi:hypothetical protein [Glycomyces sp. NRRL B-16210]|uniref:hypothetical protein n=1 Tax=Glycomyces sp. NRRL B-16210 TaxID=1463821 RepID=UPI001060FC6B|nr:hypothetical protein [Glycomyces sp. NRRL B-16210]